VERLLGYAHERRRAMQQSALLDAAGLEQEQATGKRRADQDTVRLLRKLFADVAAMRARSDPALSKEKQTV
jgi:hypothetical protein